MKKHNIQKKHTKRKSKKHNTTVFNAAIFTKVITEIIKNICEIVKHWHK